MLSKRIFEAVLLVILGALRLGMNPLDGGWITVGLLAILLLSFILWKLGERFWWW